MPWKLWSTLTLLLVLNSSCAQVTVQDEQFWGVNGMGATGVHTLTSAVTHVGEEQWLSMSIGMICETGGTFGDIKLAFEQLCEIAGSECTVDVQNQAAQVFRNIEKAHGGPLTPNMSLPLLKAVLAARKKP